MSPSAIASLARDFWKDTGLGQDFPRPIEQAVALKLPVAIVKLPALNIETVHRWLSDKALACPAPKKKMDLFGCIYALRGKGILFVSGSDNALEQRFTIAHEVGHFVLDYLKPRDEQIRQFGKKIIEVLDGARTATTEERLRGILRGLKPGAHLHLLPRSVADQGQSSHEHAEDDADDFGLELVAPRKTRDDLINNLLGEQQSEADIMDELVAYFGIPHYAFSEALRKKLKVRHPSFIEQIVSASRRENNG